MRSAGALALFLVIAIVAGCGGNGSDAAPSAGGAPATDVAGSEQVTAPPVDVEPAPIALPGEPAPMSLPAEVREPVDSGSEFNGPSSVLEAMTRAELVRGPVCQDGEIEKLRTATETPVAIALGQTRAYNRPEGRVAHRFEVKNANDFPTLFAVLAAELDEACNPTWYRVQLPVKPNGSVGWIRASDVEIEIVTTRIEIDLSDRQILLFDEGEQVLTLTAAIGAADTPTPTGRYYVNQRIRTLSPDGPFGPGAIGISAFSEVLQGWAQGGPIAIHGTNQPASIGRAASFGCLRVHNDEVELLFELVPAGTPVEIKA